MLNSTEHEVFPAYKYFFNDLRIKIPLILAILTIICGSNFMLSSVELKKVLLPRGLTFLGMMISVVNFFVFLRLLFFAFL